MITYFHHPNCSKSIKGLELLSKSKLPFNICDYLKNPPNKQTLAHIITHYNGNPLDLIRNTENIKTNNKQTLINHLYNHTKNIQRPILIHNNTIILGRPINNIRQFIDAHLS